MLHNKSSAKLLLAIPLFACLVPQFATASLVGDVVNGSLTPYDMTLNQEFISQSVVGAGVEFTGIVSDTFSQQWELSIDIDESSFTVDIFESTRNGDGNLERQQSPLVKLDLWDFDFSNGATISDLVQLDYVCTASDFACSLYQDENSISVLNFDKDSIEIGFSVLRSGKYSFDIETSVVPLPPGLLLMTSGLFGLAFFTRRNKENPTITG
jgi:hypothetical protein